MTAPSVATFRALGTTATIAVTDASALPLACQVLTAEVSAIDRACSRFRDDSELHRVELAAPLWTPISPRLLEALRVALRAARLTNGLVTPTVGGPMRAAGYDRDLAALRPTAEPARHEPAPDWRAIELDVENRRVRLPRGVHVDLGSTAKALAADRVAAAVAAKSDSGVLVSLGGDIRVRGPAPEGGWRVWAGDVHDRPERGVARLRLHTGGLATSSVCARRWRRAGAELHHILDPRTGRPADGPWRTVSVAAASCVDANIASTASILLGAKAPAWLVANALPARLAAHDGRVVTVARWPAAPAAPERDPALAAA